jgi:hypothetical protein
MGKICSKHEGEDACIKILARQLERKKERHN